MPSSWTIFISSGAPSSMLLIWKWTWYLARLTRIFDQSQDLTASTAFWALWMTESSGTDVWPIIVELAWPVTDTCLSPGLMGLRVHWMVSIPPDPLSLV